MYIEVTKGLGNNDPSNKEGILIFSVLFWFFWHATYAYLNQFTALLIGFNLQVEEHCLVESLAHMYKEKCNVFK